jgi:hypothetical protein
MSGTTDTTSVALATLEQCRTSLRAAHIDMQTVTHGWLVAAALALASSTHSSATRCVSANGSALFAKPTFVTTSRERKHPSHDH